MSETPSNQVAVQSGAMLDKTTDSWVDVVRPISILAGQIADTDFVPKALRGNAPAIAAAILHGREVGLPPLTALAQTHVIEGRPSLSAEAQRALVYAAGHEIEIMRTTGADCLVRGRRKGSTTWLEVLWNLDMARAANLTNKTNWKNWPRRMLQARATAELCQLLFPDVLHGMRATEELEDDGDYDAPEAAADRPAVVSTSKTTVARAAKKTAAPPPRQIPSGLPQDQPPAPDIPPMPEPAAPMSGGEAASGSGEDQPHRLMPQEPLPDPETGEIRLVHAAVTPPQLRMLGVSWGMLGVTDDGERHEYTRILVGRDFGDTTKNLTKPEAIGLINQLTEIRRDVLGEDTLDPTPKQRKELRDALEKLISERAEQ